MYKLTITLLFIFPIYLAAQKPIVWIYTDMTDKTLPGKNKENTINDPDDISAMAGYLLMANHFDTKSIVVASTHRKEHQTTPDQAKWADRYFGDAYRHDVVELNKKIGGYPTSIQFLESSIKKSGERYQTDQQYRSLKNYSTIKALLDVANQTNKTINVLCWGSLTEPAILVNHCLNTGQTKLLQQFRFIAHWTSSYWHQGSMDHPENVANCREDATACAYLKQMALDGHIQYYECGAIGQHGIVSGGQKGNEYFDQFKTSRLGKIFAEGKYVHNGVDHSDAATYWTLLGNWGVNLNDINNNGTNYPEIEKNNEEKFKNWSHRIHDELLRRSNTCKTNN